MPELPEVETIRRGLARHIVGRRVLRVEGRAVQMRRPLDPVQIGEALQDQRFTGVRRRGKYLLLDAGSGTLLVHLGMSGQFVLTDTAADRAPHTHCVILLEAGQELRLVDPRRFGFADWLAEGDEAADASLTRLGVDPLDGDLVAHLPCAYKCRRVPVKSLLLDQRLVAGIGNIYATEALWMAGIRPLRRGRDISVDRLETLAKCVVEVLDAAIEQGGTTLKDFVSAEGAQGYFAVRLQAYGREGLPCARCERPLKRAVIGGRATAWCPCCQT